ncbi:MAG: D-alanyl-D-alanine carboxypeptidase/D-alanyl-D-alanine-endopeptidase [Gemmatimonadetes bacterium]|jgi:D-alanyl-D-alanine carboxypeptidase/D-alanyl-D-alanine-endopeptidase (penicillin-binding protein 4)|nr:D-alanyl-D-alanine carboxypeptidase/D-alanyl-D-alanine-endopeptidase [Gemmatimonadota bacterium]
MRAALSVLLASSVVVAGCTTINPPTTTLPAPASAAQAVSPTMSRLALQQYIDSLVDVPEFRSTNWGLLVVDPGRGETLYARNADKLFMPASNQKLITGSTAITQLGLGHRWSTTLFARGAVRDGQLDGDLVVRGNGDPSISAHMHPTDALEPLRALADSLKAHGITRVRGQLVAAPSPFLDSGLGYGWSWDDLDAPYSAGVDALYFNEGFTQVVVYGGARAGDPVRAVTRPAATYPALIVRARTVAGMPATATRADSVAAAAAITLAQDSSRAGVLVSGTIAAGDSVVQEITFRDHPRAFLAAFGEALQSRGVNVFGATVKGGTSSVDSIVTMQSPTLREVMPYFEKPSQNQIGEILYRTLALKATGVGRTDTASQVVSRQLLAWGAAPDGFVVRDGSGLSRHDYVSPRTIVKVLDAMRRSPDFQVFYDALPIAGVDGTIRNRMKGTAAAGNVHAKTGTLDKARSLSGYVTTADGRVLLFSALCNNYVVPTRRVDQVTDALSVRLASMRLDP